MTDRLPAALREALHAPYRVIGGTTFTMDELEGAEADVRADRARAMASALRWAVDVVNIPYAEWMDAIETLEGVAD